jgi:hypothetical protein
MIVVIMIGIVVVGYAIAFMTSPVVAAAPVEKSPKVCPLHDWVYDPTDKLVCSRCGLRPGTIKTEGGNY